MNCFLESGGVRISGLFALRADLQHNPHRMLELGKAAETLHRRIGFTLAQGPWAGLYTLGRQGGWIAGGAVEGGMPAERIFECRTAEEVAARLREVVSPGDAVLFKASRSCRLEDVVRRLMQNLGE